MLNVWFFKVVSEGMVTYAVVSTMVGQLFFSFLSLANYNRLFRKTKIFFKTEPLP